MKHTTSTLLRISGGTDNDQVIASEFCLEALAEVKKRADGIEDVCNLGHILDAGVISDVQSALAGIRHITAAVKKVAEFHAQGKLGGTFQQLESQLGTIQAKAEGAYSWLCSLYPPPSAIN